MKTSIFIVSYARDFDWLEYLFKSTARHCSGFHEVVIAVPVQDLPHLERFGLTKEKVASFSDAGFASGFQAHQFIKCCADMFCEGDVVVHVDSDCQFIAPTTPETFITPEGKCINLCTRYDSLNKEKVNSPWQPGVELILGEKAPFETMRKHGNCYPIELYGALRKHVESVHHQTLETLVRPMDRAANFSEFNLMGSFGMSHMPDRFHFIDTDVGPVPANTINQMWSHHRPTHPDVKQKLFEYGLL